MIKVPWWKKIALYLLTHGEQNRLELQSWREEKVGGYKIMDLKNIIDDMNY